jgi:hypothetical protein
MKAGARTIISDGAANEIIDLTIATMRSAIATRGEDDHTSGLQ